MSVPIIILKEGTEETKEKEARMQNINAIKAITETVKSTLGPKGMNKMLVDSVGDVTITNDGADWTATVAAQDPGADLYRLNSSIDTWVADENLILLASAVTISSDITLGTNETFDLRFDAPTSTTVGVQQSITVTASVIKH